MIKERDILALLLTKGLGPKGVSRILSAVASQSLQIDLSFMSIPDMIQRIGVKSETAEQIPASIKKADELIRELEAHGIKVLVRGHEGYPERLFKTLKEDAPLVLFARGNIKILSQKAVGFCGSRKASEKGLAVAGECAGALAKRHINVISGYAHGVDLAAHKAALEAGGVTTFILAEGILHFKIKSDVKDLLKEENHVVVSEYMPRLPWLARNAMQRNKTICGLSNVVVVIESGMQGGTFEAGKTALDLKRPLFVAEYAQPAVTAEGNNFFLQKGARYLRKRNGAAYLDKLFEAVEKDEYQTHLEDYKYGEIETSRKYEEIEKESPLVLWEHVSQYSAMENVKASWDTFYKALIESICVIEDKYFIVERHNDDAALRERVYCYELYHQLRDKLPVDFPYTVHGELDKQNHHFIINLLGQSRVPDFLVHKPGDMEQDANLAIIEVKTAECSIAEAKTDLNKIMDFLTKAKYHYGVFLRFGARLSAATIRTSDKRIVLLHHKRTGEMPYVIGQSL